MKNMENKATREFEELMERMGGQSEAKLTGQRLTIRLDFPEVG